MRIYKAKDYVDMSRKAANIIAAQIQLKPDCQYCFCTGYYETKLCSGACNRIYSDRSL